MNNLSLSVQKVLYNQCANISHIIELDLQRFLSDRLFTAYLSCTHQAQAYQHTALTLAHPILMLHVIIYWT